MRMQAVLTVVLSSALLYAWFHTRTAPVIAYASAACALVGIAVVWLPEQANELAHLFQIGRGADFILYVWAALSLIIVLNLHLRLRAEHELVTILARKAALQSLEYPSGRGDITKLRHVEGSGIVPGMGPAGARSASQLSSDL